ncbi:MAG: hypothetical protein QOF77_1062 [Solirubrobacteraceae bacterium]|nr:hypothetical protein [Solirubrobacteraceae bacterium]
MRSKPNPSTSAAALSVGRSSAFVWLVRAGFVARGLVYGVIGALALALALGAAGGSTTNQQGALALISGAPLGGLAVAALAAGLLAYAVWQIGQGVLGRGLERGGSDDAVERIGSGASGVAYLGLFAIAVKTLVGSDSNGSGAPHRAAAGVLGWPGGQWIVGLTGLVFVGVSLYQAYEGLRGGFLDDAKTEEMSADMRRFLDVLGRVGLVSRAVVFALIGYFLIVTAIDYDPGKAVGIDGALREVARQPYGSWLLGLVAVGLMIFAAGSFAEARYRRL